MIHWLWLIPAVIAGACIGVLCYAFLTVGRETDEE